MHTDPRYIYSKIKKTKYANHLKLLLVLSLPDRPQSEQETNSSEVPVFLFSLASPKQKSQYGLGAAFSLPDVAGSLIILPALVCAELLFDPLSGVLIRSLGNPGFEFEPTLWLEFESDVFGGPILRSGTKTGIGGSSGLLDDVDAVIGGLGGKEGGAWFPDKICIDGLLGWRPRPRPVVCGVPENACVNNLNFFTRISSIFMLKKDEALIHEKMFKH